MKFKIFGASKETGVDVELVVDAANVDAAIQTANGMNILVASVTGLETGLEAKENTSSERSINNKVVFAFIISCVIFAAIYMYISYYQWQENIKVIEAETSAKVSYEYLHSTPYDGPDYIRDHAYMYEYFWACFIAYCIIFAIVVSPIIWEKSKPKDERDVMSRRPPA